MTTLFLARHGLAESGAVWHGPDRERPLTAEGRAQADRLGAALVDEDVQVVASSPWARCAETAARVAAAAGVRLQVDERLGYDRPDLEGWVASNARLTRGGIVAVSHGDLIPAYLRGAGVLTGLVPFGTGAAFRVALDGGRPVGAVHLDGQALARRNR